MTKPTNPLEFEDRCQWRTWLKKNHSIETEAWLILYKKKYQDQGLTLDEAVEEALCFGWIDSTLRSLDEKRYALRYSPRKQNSIWSMSNIQRVEKLIAEGKMTAAGNLKVTEAKQSGAWEAAIRREQVHGHRSKSRVAMIQPGGRLNQPAGRCRPWRRTMPPAAPPPRRRSRIRATSQRPPQG